MKAEINESPFSHLFLAVKSPIRILLQHLEERVQRPNLLGGLRISQPRRHGRILQHFFQAVLKPRGRVDGHEFRFVVHQNFLVHLDGVRVEVVHELVLHETGRGDDHSFDDVEVNVTDNGLKEKGYGQLDS